MKKHDEILKTNVFEKEVRERLEVIIARKRRENEALLKRLVELDENWDKVEKYVEDGLNKAQERTKAEERTAKKAKRLIGAPRDVVAEPGIFKVAGKINQSETKIPLPGLLLKIYAETPAEGKEEKVLAEIRTDRYGNFTAALSGEELDKIKGRDEKPLTFIVYSDPETAVYSKEIKTRIQSRRALKDIILDVPVDAPGTDDVSKAGKRVRDHVSARAEHVEKKLKRLEERREPLKELTRFHHERLKKLIGRLSKPIPDLPKPTSRDTEEPPKKKPPKKPQTFKPGEECPVSGQYKNTTTGSEVTVVKGEPFPPTPKSGQEYVLIDKTVYKRTKKPKKEGK